MPSRGGQPRVRRGTVRVSGDVATRIRTGHPLLFRDALGRRPLQQNAGDLVASSTPAGSSSRAASSIRWASSPCAWSPRNPDGIFDAATTAQRVEAAKRLREQLVARRRTPRYRVLHAEGDALPGITVDRYGDFLVAHLYSSAFEPLRDSLYDALEAAYKPRAIYEQRRFRPQTGEGQREPASLARGEVAPVELEVQEGGIKFVVDVTAPLGTGLFPDLREGRQRSPSARAGKRVLNLFLVHRRLLGLGGQSGRARDRVGRPGAQGARARAPQPAGSTALDEGARDHRRRRLQGAGEDGRAASASSI